VNCTATDASSNTATGSFNVIVTSSLTKPTITGVPSPITMEATGATGAVVTYTNPTASDANGAVTVTCSPASGSTFALGTATVTCSATNAAGTSTATFTVKVQDTTKPVLTLPADINKTSSAPLAVSYTVTATDTVDPHPTVSCTPASGSTFPLGTTPVNCTATDASSNTATGSFNVIVTSSLTKPTITGVPSPITIEATGATGAVVTYTNPTASDQNGAVTVTCTPASGSTFALGTTTVTCSATNAAGTSTATFTVKVQDTTKPVLTLPADITKTSSAPLAVSYTVTATDTVDPSPTVSCAPASGSTFPLGTTPVNCTATDASGNTATGSFNVTVAIDQASGSVGAGGTVSTPNPPAPSNPLQTSVTSPNAGDISIVEVPASGTPPTGFAFLGVQAVISAPAATAGSPLVLEFRIDASLLPGGVDFTNVAISRDGVLVAACTDPTAASPDPCVASRSALAGGGADLTVRTSHASTWTLLGPATSGPPVITVPANIGVVTPGPVPPQGVPVSYTTSAKDAQGNPLTVNCTPKSGSLFKHGTTTVTCSATDAKGNSASATFTVTVVSKPEAKPTITAPHDFTVEATGPSGAVVSYTVTVTDPVGTPTLTCTPPSGSAMKLGDTHVHCTAVDDKGNTADPRDFTVHVVDTTPPVISGVPANISVSTTRDDVAVTYTPPTATDLVDGPVGVHCDPHSGDKFHKGTTVVHCDAQDSHGNHAQATFTVTVTKVEHPLQTPNDITVEATGPGGATVTYTVVVNDPDGTPTLVCTPPSGSLFKLGNTHVQCKLTDTAGNHFDGGFDVHVVDTTPPVISAVPADMSVTTGTPDAVVTYALPTATDTVDGSVGVQCDPHSGDHFHAGTTIVRCTAQDKSGNKASATFNVTVVSAAKPHPDTKKKGD
jgi:hypothetical protein